MPMDDYNLTHRVKYDYYLNIYSNSNEMKVVDYIVNKVYHNFNETLAKKRDFELRTELLKHIKELQNGLAILEDKHTTSISRRVLHPIVKQEFPETKQILITVWRGSYNSEIV